MLSSENKRERGPILLLVKSMKKIENKIHRSLS